ncbi:unnamed protein product, partial [Rotaria sp. Silwood2]
MVRNAVVDCPDAEDERYVGLTNLPFQDFCDNYTHLPSLVIDGQSETDETHCEEWPCANPYTICNSAWTCPNGADEVDCNPESKCYPNGHLCVSPFTLEMNCLPMNRAGDGIIDCLGSIDERAYCREKLPEMTLHHYRCWNSTECVLAECEGLGECPFENTRSFESECYNENQAIAQALSSAITDFNLGGLFAK